MKPEIIELLEKKGLKIPERDFEELARHWADLQLLKRGFEADFPSESDIALHYLPGGDHP